MATVCVPEGIWEVESGKKVWVKLAEETEGCHEQDPQLP